MSEYIVDFGSLAMLSRVVESESNRLSEPVVRCRDCMFFIADVSTVDERGEQIATGNLCEWTELWVEPSGFCSWAERRDA